MTAPDPEPASHPSSLEGTGRTTVFAARRGTRGKVHALAGSGDRTYCGRPGPWRVAPSRSYETGDWCRACARAVGGAR